MQTAAAHKRGPDAVANVNELGPNGDAPLTANEHVSQV